MEDSWPAWGGSTSVGTTRRREVEKSRRRARGASNTISCLVVHDGACRVVGVISQRGRANAVGPRGSAAVQHLPSPSRVTAAPSIQLSNSPEARLGEGTGGSCGTALTFG